MAIRWDEQFLDSLLYVLVCSYVWIAPFSKVEESFMLQATHDLLNHGLQLDHYDHHMFPGVVPRTFLGSMVISSVAYPVQELLSLVGAALPQLVLVRCVLALGSVLAYARLRAAVSTAWGRTEGRLFLLLSLLQFHLPWYMSRTLPNIFALAMANLAHAELLSGSGYRCLAFLAVGAAIFRCDLLLLIAPVGLLLVYQQRVSFLSAAAATAGAAAFGAALSVAVDSVMWRRLLWPEFEVLWFNTAENKSSEWGTQPPLWYFYSALPRSVPAALVLSVPGVLFESRARGPALVALTFVVLYSLLPHKELRFLFPALPLITAAGAAGGARLLRFKSSFLYSFSILGMLGLFAASSLLVFLGVSASAYNYPGGVALRALHQVEPVDPPISVHIGNLAAMNGVSRFLEERRTWTYSKEEGLGVKELGAKGFDRLLTEWPEVPGYRCQAVVEGYDRVKLHLKVPEWPLKILMKPQVYVLSRDPAGKTVSCTAEAPRWA